MFDCVSEVADEETEDPVLDVRAGAEGGMGSCFLWLVAGASPWAGEEEEDGTLRVGGLDALSVLAEPPGSAPLRCALLIPR